jgi:stage V sporulation protein B
MESSKIDQSESSKATSDTNSKIIKGSFLMMISYLFFRVGGYIYRILMSRMLGPNMYGVFGATLPFQGVFQILSAGGMQPVIAKFVAQYNAVGEEDMARQVVTTSLKYMMVSGILFGLFMFFTAGWIATNIFHKPEATLPFQAISLITPFSVIVGAFRGAFQGVYKMELIVASRVVEQVTTILVAVTLVAIGFSAVGAVLGTGVGFIASSICALILFKKYIWPLFPKPLVNFSFRDELGLIKTLLIFSIPVAVTALSEMLIYDISTWVIFRFMTDNYNGYYTNASAMARLPLIISLSVAAVILPAASEAASLKDTNRLGMYITQSYRYVILLVLPLCVGIAAFAQPLISLLFGPDYTPGAPALRILVIGMAFYTLFMVSSSIMQGIGHPRRPMAILLAGIVVNLILNVLIVPKYGIEGAAAATTMATFFLMVAVLWETFRVTKVNVPYLDFVKIGIASAIMGIPIYFLPKSYEGLLAVIIISPIIYTIVFALIGGFTKRDVRLLRRYKKKLGPLSGAVEGVVKFIERFIK